MQEGHMQAIICKCCVAIKQHKILLKYSHDRQEIWRPNSDFSKLAVMFSCTLKINELIASLSPPSLPLKSLLNLAASKFLSFSVVARFACRLSTNTILCSS